MNTKTVKTIDITPTWAAAAEMILALLENGTEEGKAEARIEIRRMGAYLDAFKAVDWGTVTSAAEIRGQQWRHCVDNESPENCIDELWEAGHDERVEMAELTEHAVKGAWEFLHGDKS